MSFKMIFAVIFFFFFSVTCSAQTEKSMALVDEAWKVWQKNDHELVRQKFLGAISEDSHNVRAYLGFTLLNMLENRQKEAWDMFKKVIENQPAYQPYVYSMMLTNIISGKELTNPEVVDLYRKLAADPDKGGILKVMANERLGKYYQSVRNFYEAEKSFGEMNIIDKWLLIGPFDNISASGFDKFYPPETEFASDKTYEGQNHIPVKWRELKVNRRDGWIDFTRYYAQNNAVYYGNTFVNSPKEQLVQIRIGTSGSLKAFLNDQLIIDVFDEYNNDVDTYCVEVNLHEGWNRLLIKCGYSEIKACNFLVRVTDLKGNEIEDIKYSVQQKSYNTNQNADVKQVGNFAEVFFKEKIKSNPEEPENYIFLADAYLRNDKSIEAELVLNDAIKRFPECMLFYHKIAEAYLRGKKNDEMETAYERIFNADKNIPDVLQYKIMNYSKNEEYEKADELVKLLEKISPGSEILYQVLFDLYGRKKQIDKILELTAIAREKYPFSYEYVYLDALISYQKTKSYDEAIKMLEEHLKRNYSDNALYILSQFNLQSSNVAKWEEYMDKLIELEPASPGYYFNKAETFFSMREYEKAERAAKAALDLCPYCSQYWSRLGEIFKMQKKNDRSIEAYSEALKYNPADYDARETIRELKGRKSLFQHFGSEDVMQLVKNSPSKEKYPADNGVILLDDMKRIVYKKGASESSEEILIKLFNKKAIDEIKEYWINYNSNERLIVEKAVVIKKDGSEIKADVNDNHIVFKALEENDFVYIKHRIKNEYAGKLSNYYWDSFNFNGFYPMSKVSYSVLLEEDSAFKYKTQNMPENPEIRKVEDGSVYSWVLKDQPSIQAEHGMPPLNDVGKVLYISNIPDWSYLADWYADLAKNKARSSFEIKEQVAKLFDGKTNLTDEKKIEIIYDFITENIRYSSVSFRQSGLIPQKARDVLISKIGDCKDVATLCKAMLLEAGIKSDYVLVNTNDNGRNFNVLPSLCFNHCILNVETKQGSKFIDLTASNYSVNSLPQMDIDAFYLLIKPGTVTPGRIPKNIVPNNTIRRSSAEIKSGGEVELITESRKTGALSASMREAFRFIDTTEVRKSIIESLGSSFANVKLLEFGYNNLNDIEVPLDYWYKIEIPNLISEAGNFSMLKIPWLDKFDTDYGLSYDKRNFPYYRTQMLDTLTEEINIKVPAGFVPMEPDISASQSSVFADYYLKCTYKDGIIRAKRSIIYKKQEISTDEYAACKEFYNKVLKVDSKQILLKKNL